MSDEARDPSTPPPGYVPCYKLCGRWASKMRSAQNVCNACCQETTENGEVNITLAQLESVFGRDWTPPPRFNPESVKRLVDNMLDLLFGPVKTTPADLDARARAQPPTDPAPPTCSMCHEPRREGVLHWCPACVATSTPEPMLRAWVEGRRVELGKPIWCCSIGGVKALMNLACPLHAKPPAPGPFIPSVDPFGFLKP